MSQGFMKKGLLSGAVAAAAFAAVPTQSDAGIVYDIRAVSATGGALITGDDQVTVAGAGTVSLQLWARVTGTDGNVVNEGLQQNYIVMQSTEVSGNLFDGALGSGFRVAPFTQSGRNGFAAELNGDGVGDWGSNSTQITDLGYMQARSTNPTRAGGTVGVQVAGDPNSWDFLVARWTLTVNGLNAEGGETHIGPVRPVADAEGSNAYIVFHDDAPTIAVDSDGDPETPPDLFFVEGSQSTVGSGPDTADNSFGGRNYNAETSGAYADFITFVPIPEPTSLALFGLAGAGLLSRRRRI